MAKIGLFGGSFNPIHNGHMNLALSVKKSLGLDRIILIPSGTSPHKSSSEYAPAEDRLEMCRLACEGYDGFEVSDYEITKPGKSYTVYTVRHFRELFPEDELYLLVGSDMLLSFDTWFEYREILEKVTVAAVSRTGDDTDELLKMTKKLSDSGKCIVVNADAVTISSSEIRKMIKNNIDLSCYLNGKVVKYIMLKKLYI
ncbi:MAG: nicotinate (nicotinamide) nucleotide adenylyltransferase [Oscillospiraceae bacterium]|nr:nicotinate (nicotinamide) nucleotide adenylyltransferase [Oscillospiraceae bacterium]